MTARYGGLAHDSRQPSDGAQVTLTVAVPSEQCEMFRARVSDLSARQAQITAGETVYLPP